MPHHPSRRVAALALAALSVAACTGEDLKTDDANVPTAPPTSPASSTTSPTSSAPPTTTASVPGGPYVSALYADPAHWVCRPDVDDVCEGDLDVTEVAADGSLRIDRVPAPTDQPADCFYVYPTVSEDPTVRSDLVPGREIETVRVQAARFREVCRVFAPLYRSVTVAGLLGGNQAGALATAWPDAYADVLDAWRHYLANDNDGRPVLLLGHSQGSGHLTRLLSEEIDPDPAQRAVLVSAMLLGTNFAVPDGADVGGATQQIPLCRRPDQIGCVVTYAAFRADDPPGPGALFGQPWGTLLGPAEGVSGCTNPPALEGGPGEPATVFPAGSWAFADPATAPAITTPFMSLPGFVTTECVADGDHRYLAVTVHADPADPRTDVLPGDLAPGWGLHLIDVQLTQGTLVGLARTQIEAWLAGT